MSIEKEFSGDLLGRFSKELGRDDLERVKDSLEENTPLQDETSESEKEETVYTWGTDN